MDRCVGVGVQEAISQPPPVGAQAGSNSRRFLSSQVARRKRLPEQRATLMPVELLSASELSRERLSLFREGVGKDEVAIAQRISRLTDETHR